MSRPPGAETGRAQPRPCWDVLLTVLILHPFVIVLLGADTPDRLALAGFLAAMLANLVQLGAAGVLLFVARISGTALPARMSTAVTLFAVQDLPMTLIAMTDPRHATHLFHLTSSHLAMALILLALCALGVREQRPPRLNPMLLGLLLGLFIVALHVCALAYLPTPYLSPRVPSDVPALATIAALNAMMCASLIRSDLPRWASIRISAAVGGLFLAHLWSSILDGSRQPTLSVILVAASSAVLCTTVGHMMVKSLSQMNDTVAGLLQRATTAEATVLHDREVVHEVSAVTAGVLAGSQLLARGQVPPGPRRVALEQMLEAEAARLHRTLRDASPDLPDELALDDLIEPLVVAQEVLGHHIEWRSSNLRVRGSRDALSEAINILLNNAWRHGHGAATSIRTSATPEAAQIRVSDHGPGLSPEVHPHLFQWGARDLASPGQGIGLHRAHRLLLENGGSLEWESNVPFTGTTFVMTVPRVVDRSAASVFLAFPRADQSTGIAG